MLSIRGDAIRKCIYYYMLMTHTQGDFDDKSHKLNE